MALAVVVVIVIVIGIVGAHAGQATTWSAGVQGRFGPVEWLLLRRRQGDQLAGRVPGPYRYDEVLVTLDFVSHGDT